MREGVSVAGVELEDTNVAAQGEMPRVSVSWETAKDVPE